MSEVLVNWVRIGSIDLYLLEQLEFDSEFFNKLYNFSLSLGFLVFELVAREAHYFESLRGQLVVQGNQLLVGLVGETSKTCYIYKQISFVSSLKVSELNLLSHDVCARERPETAGNGMELVLTVLEQ